MVLRDLERFPNKLKPDKQINLNNLENNNQLTTEISLTEIKTTISKMKNKAAGRSQINKKDLCNLPEHSLKKLRDIFNGCLATGYFPKVFKQATIILILKPGKPSNKVENFRPISLLKIPGKILERIINSRLMTHLKEENILNEKPIWLQKGQR